MATNQHIIRRQVLDLQLPRQATAFEFQEQLYQVCKKTLIPALEKVFDQYADPHTLIRLDRLEITLEKPLRADQLESDFMEGVLAAAQNALAGQLSNAPSLHGKSSISQTSREAGLTALWAFYLSEGYLPWWSPYQGFQEFEVALGDRIKEDKKKRNVQRIWQEALPKVAPLRRLIYQFSDELLSLFFTLVHPKIPVRSLLQGLQSSLGQVSMPIRKSRFHFWQTTYHVLSERPFEVSFSDTEGEKLATKIWIQTLSAIAQELGENAHQLILKATKELLQQPNLSPILTAVLTQILPTGTTEASHHVSVASKERISSEEPHLNPADPLLTNTSLPLSEKTDSSDPLAAPIAEDFAIGSPERGSEKDQAALADTSPLASTAPSASAPTSSQEPLPSEITPHSDPLSSHTTEKTTSSEHTIPHSPETPRAPISTSPWREFPKIDEDIYVQDAGLVLLHPFFQTLFESQELLDKGVFKGEDAKEKGVQLLAYLSRGEDSLPEAELTLHKLLCGVPFEEPIEQVWTLSESAKTDCEDLLKAVITYWNALGSASPDGLRQGYIQREGKIVRTDKGWKLTVEKKTQDILMGKLPWGIGAIALPWREELLMVDWA